MVIGCVAKFHLLGKRKAPNTCEMIWHADFVSNYLFRQPWMDWHERWSIIPIHICTNMQEQCLHPTPTFLDSFFSGTDFAPLKEHDNKQIGVEPVATWMDTNNLLHLIMYLTNPLWGHFITTIVVPNLKFFP